MDEKPQKPLSFAELVRRSEALKKHAAQLQAELAKTFEETAILLDQIARRREPPRR